MESCTHKILLMNCPSISEDLVSAVNKELEIIVIYWSCVKSLTDTFSLYKTKQTTPPKPNQPNEKPNRKTHNHQPSKKTPNNLKYNLKIYDLNNNYSENVRSKREDFSQFTKCQATWADNCRRDVLLFELPGILNSPKHLNFAGFQGVRAVSKGHLFCWLLSTYNSVKRHVWNRATQL